MGFASGLGAALKMVFFGIKAAFFALGCAFAFPLGTAFFAPRVIVGITSQVSRSCTLVNASAELSGSTNVM